jgi:Rrf2 family protein
MKISTKGRYALRLMIDLAENNIGQFIVLKDISSRQEISIKYLEQIVTQLSKAGFLKSVRGPQGGYKLAKDPKEYTVGEILRVTEGSLSPISCLDDISNQCTRFKECATIDFWLGLDKTINDYVDRFTLSDLVENHKKHNPLDYMI